MSVKVDVPQGLAEELLERHGNRLIIVARRDWNKIRKIIRKYPRALRELKVLKMKITPLEINKRVW